MNTGEPDTRDMFSDHPAHISDELNEKIDPGQHFAMDFGLLGKAASAQCRELATHMPGSHFPLIE